MFCRRGKKKWSWNLCTRSQLQNFWKCKQSALPNRNELARVNIPDLPYGVNGGLDEQWHVAPIAVRTDAHEPKGGFNMKIVEPPEAGEVRYKVLTDPDSHVRLYVPESYVCPVLTKPDE